MSEEEKQIPVSQLRPRFSIETEFTGSQIAELINKGLKSDGQCVGEAHDTYAYLKIPEADIHYWSPQLSLTFDEEDGATTVRGMYGPKSSVWTLFVFSYAAIGFAMLIVLLVGLTQSTMNGDAPILWLLPILFLMLTSAYLVSYFGKLKGHDQSEVLHRYFEEKTGLRYSVD